MKTQVSNKEIMEWYLKGYEDESFGTSTTESTEDLLNTAYSLGASHVLPNREYNILTESEVLRRLK